MTTKEILQGALALFGPNGENWTAGQPNTESKQHCAVTAIAEAEGWHKYSTREKCWKVVNEANAIDKSLVSWNAQATWPEVKAAFEKAIEAC